MMGWFARAALSVLAGLVTRCPRPLRGRMFRSFFRIQPRCPACAYAFLGYGEFTGAMMFAQFLWTGVALYGYYFLAYGAGASTAFLAAWVVGFGLAVPLLTYRNVKGLWVGVLHAGQSLEQRPGAA